MLHDLYVTVCLAYDTTSEQKTFHRVKLRFVNMQNYYSNSILKINVFLPFFQSK